MLRRKWNENFLHYISTFMFTCTLIGIFLQRIIEQSYFTSYFQRIKTGRNGPGRNKVPHGPGWVQIFQPVDISRQKPATIFLIKEFLSVKYDKNLEYCITIPLSKKIVLGFA